MVSFISRLGLNLQPPYYSPFSLAAIIFYSSSNTWNVDERIFTRRLRGVLLPGRKKVGNRRGRSGSGTNSMPAGRYNRTQGEYAE